MRAIIVLLSAFLALPVEAKIVAKRVEQNGTVFLHDTPCTFIETGLHLEGRDNANAPTFVGCWLEMHGVIYLVSKNGRQMQVTRGDFNWDVRD